MARRAATLVEPHPALEDRRVGDRGRWQWAAPSWSWPALVGTLVVATRLYVSRDRHAFVLWPDEPAQLAFARFVAGGARWNMHDHSTWKPGYGLLVGLIDRGVGGEDVYRVAMVTNALLAGIGAIALYALTRRLTDLSRPVAAIAVGLAVMLPGSLFVTAYAWSEPLTVVTLIGSILAMVVFDARPSVGRGLVAGAIAAAGFASHTRLLPLLGVVVVLALLAARRGGLSRRGATGVAMWCAGLFVTVTVVSRALVDRIWDEPFERNSYGGVAGQIAHLPEAMVAMVGQVWYLAVSTGGLAVIGAIGLVGAARHGRAARIALAVVGVELALSSVFMAGRWRGDHVVYGRYNDAFVGVLVVVGVHTVVRCVRRGTLWRPAAATAVVMTATWLALDRLRSRQLAEGEVVEAMVLGLQAFGGHPTIRLGSITLVALGIVVGGAAVGGIAGRRWTPVLLGCGAVALLWIGNLNAADVVRAGSTDWANDPAYLALVAVDELDRADYYLPADSDATGQMMRYQSVLPDTRFRVLDSLDAPASAVFAPQGSPQLLADSYRIVWRDPNHDIALWRPR